MTNKKHWWVRLIVLLTFWVVSYFGLLTLFATTSGERLLIDHIYTAIFIVTLLLPVTLNEWLIMPRFLDKRKYTSYVVLVGAAILGGAWFNHILFSRLIDYILPGYYFISYYELSDLLKFFVVFVVVSTLIALSLKWLRIQEESFRTNQLEKERVAAEFKALANQVNPHFLFNSLTVLYALAVKGATQTAEAILKLSDILRYVIYQSSAPTVRLRQEIDILKDFIDLQRYRVQQTVQIDLVESLSNERIDVAPMLMLPLLENSFKHGISSNASQGFVRASAMEENGIFEFKIVNNKSYSVAESGGFGLQNLRQRLQLAYPGRHKLEVSETETTFAVSLHISLN